MRWMLGIIVSAATALAGQTGVFTFSGTATGTIGGIPFTNATLTVTGPINSNGMCSNRVVNHVFQVKTTS